MSKSIQIMAIAVAFVAVTLISSVVYADDKNGKPFEAIWDAIHNLESNSVTNVYTMTNSEIIPRDIDATVKATCNGSDKVLGGGYDLLPSGVTVIADKPDGDNGWLGIFKHTSINEKIVTVEARCATMTP